MVQETTPDTAELTDELIFLRGLVEQLAAEHDVSWEYVRRLVQVYKSPHGRTSWQLTYLFALKEAAGTVPRPRDVLSGLPI